MRTKTLQVKLDTTATPPVTVLEDEKRVGKHNVQLNWVPASGESGWVFADIKQPDQVTPLANPPFSVQPITAAMITVLDDNTHGQQAGTYSYSICVKVGDTPYWSDPEIINRGGN